MSVAEPTIAWPPNTVWPPQPGGAPQIASVADFNPSIASVDVDQAVLSTLREWLPTYLRHVQAIRELDYTLALPATMASTLDDSEFLDKALPGVYVATARTQGTMQITADGSYLTTWLVAVSSIIRGRTPAETRQNASLYELACRMILIDKSSLGDFAQTTRWISGGEARPLVDRSGKGRYLGEGASQFWVFTQGTVREGSGPNAPDAEPYIPLATVQDFDIKVDGLPPVTDPTGGS